jgi:hypothetical protein
MHILCKEKEIMAIEKSCEEAQTSNGQLVDKTHKVG